MRAGLLLISSLAAAACADEPAEPADAAHAALDAELAWIGPRAPAYAPLVVTLTFDDTYDEQAEIAALLDGLPSTFYVNSSRVSTPGWMTDGDLAGLVAAGHDVGAHTLTHPRLTDLDEATRQLEMCGDRAALAALGHDALTLAYPFGADDAAVRATAAACGFEGARDIGGLRNADPWNGDAGFCGTEASSLSRPASETLPPRDAYAIRSHASIRASCTDLDLQRMVLAAAADAVEQPLAARRWLVLTFHDFCTTCTGRTYQVDVARLKRFAAWLRELGGAVPVVNASGRRVGRRPLIVTSVAEALELP